ncbi:hypothetical protein QQP08_007370 [Theobroma cacao]|nr:hypothetical protein QQP08_007370 [Theobroma cacao]
MKQKETKKDIPDYNVVSRWEGTGEGDGRRWSGELQGTADIPFLVLQFFCWKNDWGVSEIHSVHVAGIEPGQYLRESEGYRSRTIVASGQKAFWLYPTLSSLRFTLPETSLFVNEMNAAHPPNKNCGYIAVILARNQIEVICQPMSPTVRLK